LEAPIDVEMKVAKQRNGTKKTKKKQEGKQKREGKE